MATAYWELLKDPRWQKKRLEVMQRDEFQCQSCFSKTETLNVHHWFYQKGKNPWEYAKCHLVTLCEDCHEKVENRLVLLRKIIAFGSTTRGPLQFLDMLLGFAAGKYFSCDPDPEYWVQFPVDDGDWSWLVSYGLQQATSSPYICQGSFKEVLDANNGKLTALQFEDLGYLAIDTQEKIRSATDGKNENAAVIPVPGPGEDTTDDRGRGGVLSAAREQS